MKTFFVFALKSAILTPNCGSWANEPPVLWEKAFGGSNDDRAYSVQQTADGGYIIAGDTKSFGTGGNDVYLVRLGFEGCQRWDFNCDGRVDFADFAVFATHWLE